MLSGSAVAIGMSAMPIGASELVHDEFANAIIIDGLDDVFNPYAPEGQTRLSDRAWQEALATGITALRITMRPVGNDDGTWHSFEKSAEFQTGRIMANPDRFMKVDRPDDILAAKREGKIAIIWGTQDTIMIGTDLDRVPKMREFGVRQVQLTYNLRNLAGDGALEEADGGISRLGYDIIEAVEANRMLIDFSHGGQKTMHQGALHAKLPTISHTGAMAIHPHPRHVDDETIRAVADKGGTVGVFMVPYLGPDPVPSGELLLRHIEHIANVGGQDCVTLGTDNDLLPLNYTEDQRDSLRDYMRERIARGVAAPGETVDFMPMVPDYNHLDVYRQIAGDLMARGWTRTQAEKLLGLNLLRVYRAGFG
jgi:membrane dipeptidase